MIVPQDEEYDGALAIRRSREATAKPKPTRESTVVASVIALIKSKRYGGHARKTHGGAMSQRGEPDVDACVRGRAVKLEGKQIGEKPDMPQMLAMRRWAQSGALVGWFQSTRHVVEILDHLEHPGFVPDLSRPGCSCPQHQPGDPS
jgi:hypothetical protein